MYKFEPIFKSVIWGGDKIASYKGIATDRQRIGESWEISGIRGCESVVAEGPDAGMTLSELIGRDGARLLGASVAERFGDEFPLLVKFIDARQDLSIQVHPNDALARERHGTHGKTEMWYVVEAAPGAHLRTGFAREVTPAQYETAVEEGSVCDLLSDYPVRPGDVFYLPAGRIHSIGAGSFVVEIQQTSDITYRIYDFDRRDAQGNPRELHTALAKDAIDYAVSADYRTYYNNNPDHAVELVACPWFTVSLYELTRGIDLDPAGRDSFLIAICIDGEGSIGDDTGSTMPLRRGETVLIPAEARRVRIEPRTDMRLLTVRI